MITPIIVTIVLLRIIDAFKLFELIFGITSAGPANATEALLFYVYLTGIKWFDLGTVQTYSAGLVFCITAGERTLRSLKNSILIASCSSAIVLLLGAFAGYSLARFVFRGWKNKDIAVWILSNRMFPPVAVVIPAVLVSKFLVRGLTFGAIKQ